MKQIIVLLLVLLGAFSCRPKNKEGRHEILRIRNDSDKDLYYTQQMCDTLLSTYNFMGQAPAFHYYTIGVINRVMTETIAYQYTANVRFQGGDFAGGMKDLNTMMKKGYVVKVDPKYIIPKVLTIY
ncbi:hypothetical protein [Butyricimonas synergistica]|uniref:hypothetical protein n=1 Tax=Butyricimonas synergistica TaxID=544644 RepID=UPI00037B17B6|nr:hypothetical protein [Butyricimonas synergistica]